MPTARLLPRIKIAGSSAALLTLLCLSSPASAGAPVGPGPITLPPIVARYDERCLDRIDRKDEKLAARQSRDCRRPRGSRNALPVAERSTPASK